MNLNSKVKILVKLPKNEHAFNIKVNPIDINVDVEFSKNRDILEIKILPGNDDFEIKINSSEIIILKTAIVEIQKDDFFIEAIEDIKVIESIKNIEDIKSDDNLFENDKNLNGDIVEIDVLEGVDIIELGDYELVLEKNNVNETIYNFENNTMPVVDNIAEALSKVIENEEEIERLKKEEQKKENDLRVMEAFKNISVKANTEDLKDNSEVAVSEIIHSIDKEKFQDFSFSEDVKGETIYSFAKNNFSEAKKNDYENIAVETLYDKDFLFDYLVTNENNVSGKKKIIDLLNVRLDREAETFQATELEVLNDENKNSYNLKDVDISLMPRTFLSLNNSSLFEDDNKTVIMENISDEFNFDDSYIHCEKLAGNEDFDINFLQILTNAKNENIEENKFKNSWKEVKVLDLDGKIINGKKNS